MWQLDMDDDSAAPVVGTAAKAGKPVGYVQTHYGIEELTAAVDGHLVAVLGKQGETVAKGEIVAFIQ
jgi:pyruvate carboxylase subunit B